MCESGPGPLHACEHVIYLNIPKGVSRGILVVFFNIYLFLTGSVRQPTATTTNLVMFFGPCNKCNLVNPLWLVTCKLEVKFSLS